MQDAHIEYGNGGTMRSSDPNERKSPPVSATAYPVGTVREGNDKNQWVIVADSGGKQRWQKITTGTPKPNLMATCGSAAFSNACNIITPENTTNITTPPPRANSGDSKEQIQGVLNAFAQDKAKEISTTRVDNPALHTAVVGALDFLAKRFGTGTAVSIPTIKVARKVVPTEKKMATELLAVGNYYYDTKEKSIKKVVEFSTVNGQEYVNVIVINKDGKHPDIELVYNAEKNVAIGLWQRFDPIEVGESLERADGDVVKVITANIDENLIESETNEGDDRQNTYLWIVQKIQQGFWTRLDKISTVITIKPEPNKPQVGDFIYDKAINDVGEITNQSSETYKIKFNDIALVSEFNKTAVDVKIGNGTFVWMPNKFKVGDNFERTTPSGKSSKIEIVAIDKEKKEIKYGTEQNNIFDTDIIEVVRRIAKGLWRPLGNNVAAPTPTPLPIAPPMPKKLSKQASPVGGLPFAIGDKFVKKNSKVNYTYTVEKFAKGKKGEDLVRYGFVKPDGKYDYQYEDIYKVSVYFNEGKWEKTGGVTPQSPSLPTGGGGANSPTAAQEDEMNEIEAAIEGIQLLANTGDKDAIDELKRLKERLKQLK